MSQCLRIVIVIEGKKEAVDRFIQKQASVLKIEGIMQPLSETTFRIVICGVKEAIESFLDVLHNDCCGQPIKHIECEPFLKDRDYRGVFRVIGQ